MFRIRRFNVIKTSNVVALIYMVVVAIIVVPFMLLFLFSAAFASASGGQVLGGLAFGLVAVVAYGLLGWVFTAIACAIYNLVAGWIGGIEVQVEAVAPPAQPPLWMPPASATPPPTSPPAV